MSTPLNERVRSGYAWNLFAELGALVILVGAESVRSRMLTPDATGTIVPGLWLIGLLRILTEGGLTAALVQRPDLTPAQLRAVDRFARYLALAGGALCGGVAPFLGIWFRNPDVVGPAAVLGAVVFLDGLGVVRRALLTRDLNFSALVRSTLAGSITALVTLYGLAAAGIGTWAIAFSMVFSALVQLAIVESACPWEKGLEIDASRLREVIRSGLAAMGSTLLFYGYSNVDYLMLGRTVSQRDLAIYFNAYRLAELVGARVSTVVGRVAMPAFAEAASRPETIRRQYLETIELVALTSFPMAVGLAIVADDAVRLLFGPQWLDSIPVVRVLAGLFLMRSLQTVGPAALLASRQMRTNLAISLATAACLVPAMWVGAQHGPMGAALAWLAVSVPVGGAVTALAGRRIGVSLGAISGAVTCPALAAVAMGLTVVAARLMFDASFTHSGPLFLRPLVSVAVGAGVYLCAVAALSPSLLKRVRAMLVGNN